MMMTPMTMTTKQTNLVETKKIVVKQHPDIQPREKQDDVANQLSEYGSRVKYTEKHVRLVAVSLEVRMMPLTE